MFNTINRLLSRLLRLQVVRLPLPKPMRFAPTVAEVAAVEQTLAEFAALQAPDDPTTFQNDWRGYLSDRRINALGEVLEQLTCLDIDLRNKRIGDFGSGTGYLLRMIAQLEPAVEQLRQRGDLDVVGAAPAEELAGGAWVRQQDGGAVQPQRTDGAARLADEVVDVARCQSVAGGREAVNGQVQQPQLLGAQCQFVRRVRRPPRWRSVAAEEPVQH